MVLPFVGETVTATTLPDMVLIKLDDKKLDWDHGLDITGMLELDKDGVP